MSYAGDRNRDTPLPCPKLLGSNFWGAAAQGGRGGQDGKVSSSPPLGGAGRGSLLQPPVLWIIKTCLRPGPQLRGSPWKDRIEGTGHQEVNPGTGPEPPERPPHIQSSKFSVPKLVQAGLPGEPGAQARFTWGPWGPPSTPWLLLRGHCAGWGQISGQAAGSSLTSVPHSPHPTDRHRLCEVLVRGTAGTHTGEAASPGAAPNGLLCGTAAAVGLRRPLQSQRQVSRLIQPSLHPGPGSSSYLLRPARRHQLTQHLPSRCAPSTCPVPGRPGTHLGPQAVTTQVQHQGEGPRGSPPAPSPRPERWLSLGELRVVFTHFLTSLPPAQGQQI